MHKPTNRKKEFKIFHHSSHIIWVNCDLSGWLCCAVYVLHSTFVSLSFDGLTFCMLLQPEPMKRVRDGLQEKEWERVFCKDKKNEINHPNIFRLSWLQRFVRFIKLNCVKQEKLRVKDRMRQQKTGTKQWKCKETTTRSKCQPKTKRTNITVAFDLPLGFDAKKKPLPSCSFIAP